MAATPMTEKEFDKRVKDGKIKLGRWIGDIETREELMGHLRSFENTGGSSFFSRPGEGPRIIFY